jgi:hypothetical protein
MRYAAIGAKQDETSVTLFGGVTRQREIFSAAKQPIRSKSGTPKTTAMTLKVRDI